MITKYEKYLPQIESVTRDNVKLIKYENIIAFTYAYLGAQGDPGGLTFVQKTDTLKFYYINQYCDDQNLVNEVENSYFKPFSDAIKATGWLIPELDGWKKFEMGQGNFLFLRKEYVDEFILLANSIGKIVNFPVSLYQFKFILLNLLVNDEYKEVKNKIINSICHYPTLLGGIIGDVAGSRFEFSPIKTKKFKLLVKSKDYLEPTQTYKDYKETCHFTDDTITTLAIANALMQSAPSFNNLKTMAIKNLKEFGNKYPYVGYGSKFNFWLKSSNEKPYNSFGNGSAMRISAVPYFAKDINQVKTLTRVVTEITHNHPEGIKGAEAVACCIWWALNGYSRYQIKYFVEQEYYDLNFDYKNLLKTYHHDESCQNSVPQAIYAFVISTSFEDAIKNAIAMGGDADTMACIAGSIAEAYYGLPKKFEKIGLSYLTDDLKEVVLNFKIKNNFNKQKN